MPLLPLFSPLLGKARIVPVLSIDALEDAVPLAEALQAGGLDVIEVTLRSAIALQAAEAIARACPKVTPGIGTLLDEGDIKAARDAGARFLVSPGTPLRLAEALAASGLPALPGASTVSEIMALKALGFGEMKLFPAEAVGGAAFLKSVAGPLPALRFCPTGGIAAQSAPGYLALSSVLCVGGSWMVPKSMLAQRDWAGITRLAAEAAQL